MVANFKNSLKLKLNFSNFIKLIFLLIILSIILLVLYNLYSKVTIEVNNGEIITNSIMDDLEVIERINNNRFRFMQYYIELVLIYPLFFVSEIFKIFDITLTVFNPIYRIDSIIINILNLPINNINLTNFTTQSNYNLSEYFNCNLPIFFLFYLLFIFTTIFSFFYLSFLGFYGVFIVNLISIVLF